MRILVTGSRELTDERFVTDRIANFITTPDPVTLVVGDCPTGADFFARRRFQHLGFQHLDVHRADWATHGKAAGPRRNQAMVDSGADVCLAFYRDGAGNRGTTDCVRRARTAGIEVHEFTEKVRA
jgi:hypothetical protein